MPLLARLVLQFSTFTVDEDSGVARIRRHARSRTWSRSAFSEFLQRVDKECYFSGGVYGGQRRLSGQFRRFQRRIDDLVFRGTPSSLDRRLRCHRRCRGEARCLGPDRIEVGCFYAAT